MVDKQVKIDRFDGTKYAFLSNFYMHEVVMDSGVPFSSSEHAYQAYKMVDFTDYQKVSEARTAAEAKRLGNKLKKVENWDKIKVKTMYKILQCKFKDSVLKQKLLDTGDAILEEGNTWNDTFWGTVNGAGNNYLGQLLMKVRGELKNVT